MKLSSFSIHSILGLIIGFLCILSLSFALISGSVHQDYAFKNQQISIRSIVDIKIKDLLKQLVSIEHKLGLNIQQESEFRKAVLKKDIETLHHILSNKFNNYYTVTDKINIEKIAVYSSNLHTITEVKAQHSELQASEPGCRELLLRAQKRQNAERFQMLSEICNYEGQVYHSSIIPIGGIQLMGYLVIISNPLSNLIGIESSLNMAIRVTLPTGESKYQTASWLDDRVSTDFITSEYKLLSKSGKHVLSIIAMDKVRPLFENLPNISMIVMAVASLILIVVTFFAIFILRKSILTPLTILTTKIQNVSLDKRKLGEQVSIKGTREICNLANNFNKMSLELSELYQSLEKMAYTDLITDLPNRNMFKEHLRLSMNYAENNKHSFAILLMDLNHFKNINEILGHNIGDHLLCAVGKRIHNILRGHEPIIKINESSNYRLNNHFLFRLGGDEFAILISLPSAMDSTSIISNIANKILSSMEEAFTINEHSLLVGMGIGVALYPQHGTNTTDLLRKADVSLYHTKATGAGYSIYDVGQNEHNHRYLLLSRDLTNAFVNNQMELYYQPKINLQSNQVCGAEALIRWIHPELGFIPPDEFIPIAEQSGQIRQLTKWVIERAIEQCSMWRGMGHIISVSINLSSINLHDESLPQHIKTAYERFSVPANQIILEITENAIMSDFKFVVSMLTKLRKMDLKLSIDDFGTGYSSLSYVRHFPVDEIKIDKSFIFELCAQSNDEAIVRAVIVLSNHMGFSVVAEGVENASVEAKLKELGCTIIQGYHISKPMPFIEFLTWLDKHNSGKS